MSNGVNSTLVVGCKILQIMAALLYGFTDLKPLLSNGLNLKS